MQAPERGYINAQLGEAIDMIRFVKTTRTATWWTHSSASGAAQQLTVQLLVYCCDRLHETSEFHGCSKVPGNHELATHVGVECAHLLRQKVPEETGCHGKGHVRFTGHWIAKARLTFSWKTK